MWMLKRSLTTRAHMNVKLFKRFVLLHLLNGRKKSKGNIFLFLNENKQKQQQQQQQPTAPLNHKIYYLLNHCKHLHLCLFIHQNTLRCKYLIPNVSTNVQPSMETFIQSLARSVVRSFVHWFIQAEESCRVVVTLTCSVNVLNAETLIFKCNFITSKRT